jgi:hypothetical protein
VTAGAKKRRRKFDQQYWSVPCQRFHEPGDGKRLGSFDVDLHDIDARGAVSQTIIQSNSSNIDGSRPCIRRCGMAANAPFGQIQTDGARCRTRRVHEDLDVFQMVASNISGETRTIVRLGLEREHLAAGSDTRPEEERVETDIRPNIHRGHRRSENLC